ncbi:MAG: exodeoxyribonuclease VII large subunit [Dongiaceae bacterium]
MTDLPRAAARSAPARNPLPEYTVSELGAAIRRTLEGNFERVRVRGEISGLKRAASGHIYLCLKDTEAVLDAVCWKATAQRLSVRPEDGLEVVATGRLTAYPGRSKYQLLVDAIEIAGAGALLKLLEERRQRLAAEGLFDAARKRPLPVLPRVIGVVTSPTGAVIRDILHRLADRFPRHVLIWPVLVQGDGAAAQVAAAIEGFNALPAGGPVPRPDLLIVARGGGSLEDLWAFNEEIVVRAAAASAIPLISAVGHETDTTLIDFAADRRAPTPTAAAEMAVPVRADLARQVAEGGQRLGAAATRLIGERRLQVEGLARGLPEPRRIIADKAQRLDGLVERLLQSRQGFFGSRLDRVARLGAGLRHPREQIAAARHKLEAGGHQLRHQLLQLLARRDRDLHRAAAELRPRRLLDDLERRRLQLEAATRLLDSVSYERVLARGFALVRDGADQPVTSAAAVAAGEALTLQFADGKVAATAGGRKRREEPKDPAPRQPGLPF